MMCISKEIVIFFVVSQIFVGAVKYPVDEGFKSLVRKKRFLLFPEGTDAIQLIIGVGVPVETTPESIIFGWSFRAVYGIPSNTSQLMPSDYGATRRRKRYVSRWDVYKLFERESAARGYGGRSCILRSICEASDVPMNTFHGLFEELFHSVFSPTSSNEELDHHTDNEYYAAQKLGRLHRGKCGCLNFGHSCFGGMGKRISDPLDKHYELMREDFGFPGTQRLPHDDPTQFHHQQNQRQYIPRIIKQWLLNYRRIQGAPKE